MTTRNDSGKTAPGEAASSAPAAVAEPPARHVYGPRPVAALMPALVRPAFRKRSPATAQLLLDWEAIVGPDIAAMTTPRKLFSGTLAIVASGPMAMELQHVSGALIERINSHLGRIAVTRLRFVQDVTTAPARLRPPARRADAAAKAAVAGLPEGKLRDALEALGRVVLPPGSGGNP